MLVFLMTSILGAPAPATPGAGGPEIKKIKKIKKTAEKIKKSASRIENTKQYGGWLLQAPPAPTERLPATSLVVFLIGLVHVLFFSSVFLIFLIFLISGPPALGVAGAGVPRMLVFLVGVLDFLIFS